MKVVVFDYGAGNLHSLAKAVDRAGRTVHVERDARRVLDGDVLVLPGVGAFEPAAAALAPARDAIAAAIGKGHPCVGICLGMQLMFDTSEEGSGSGLGLFGGAVTRISAQRVPHIGWNAIDEVSDPVFARSGMSMAYFANGFVARPSTVEDVIAWSTHDHDRFPAAIRRGRLIGVQFHPEKSSAAGVRFLDAVLDEITS